MRRTAFLLVLLTSCGFDPDAGEDALWATPRQITEAAERCGVHGLKPTRAGAHWAAYVPKGDCIYNDLRAQDLQATR